MILHYSPKSPFVRKVMIFIHETGLDDRITRQRSVANMLIPNEELMRANPWSKIPTLVLDDGSALFDSDVICEYLDTRHDGPPLIPRDPAQRIEALRWRAFGNEMLNCLVLWRNERERPAGMILERLIEAFSCKLGAGLAALESETGALAAAPFSVGHIAIGCALGYIDFRFETIAWRDGHPELARWFETFENRESARMTRPVDDLPHVKASDL